MITNADTRIHDCIRIARTALEMARDGNAYDAIAFLEFVSKNTDVDMNPLEEHICAEYIDREDVWVREDK